MRWSGSLGFGVLLASTQAWAGPPYVTDDPEPVEYRHWEMYLASQSFHDKDGWTGTAPHFEVNYGVVPNVQLHMIAPLAYSIPDGGRLAYGYGDTELGVKFRFVQERTRVPMIGTFPLLEVPSGSRSEGLGNGSAQLFVPVWLQKSLGAGRRMGVSECGWMSGTAIDIGGTSGGRRSAKSSSGSRWARRSSIKPRKWPEASATRGSISAGSSICPITTTS
jgi:hypothetical protein